MAHYLLRWFDNAHLPDQELRIVSGYFKELATTLDERMPEGAEKTAGLRKLLEAKDCMVRSALEAKWGESNPR